MDVDGWAEVGREIELCVICITVKLNLIFPENITKVKMTPKACLGAGGDIINLSAFLVQRKAGRWLVQCTEMWTN